jgi:hypothetical protein
MAVMHNSVRDPDALVEAANTLEMNGSMLNLAEAVGTNDAQRRQSGKTNSTDSVFESKQTQPARSSCQAMLVPRVRLTGASEVRVPRGKANVQPMLTRPCVKNKSVAGSNRQNMLGSCERFLENE